MIPAVLSWCLYWTLSLNLVGSTAEVNITAAPGQSVSLPCRAPSNTNITVVEWTRPGLDPEYVLMYRDGRPFTENQHQDFNDRVELKDKEMKDGNVSIILKNVTRDDTGTFECRVILGKTNRLRRRKKRANLKTEPISTIYLKVQSGDTEERGDKETGDKDLHVGLGVGLTLFVVVVIVVFIVYRKCRKHREQSSHRAAYSRARTEPPEPDEPADPNQEGDPAESQVSPPDP